MKLSITVKPGSKKPGIEIITDTEWLIRVREPATEGKANQAIIEAVAGKKLYSEARIEIL